MSNQKPLTEDQIQAIRELLARRPAEPNASTLAEWWHLGAVYIVRLLSEIEALRAARLPARADPEVEAFVASAVEWRQRVDLRSGDPLTQMMLDKLDTIVILRGRK